MPNKPTTIEDEQKPQQEDWESRLDNSVGLEHSCYHEGGIIFKNHVLYEHIKSFISTERTKAKQEERQALLEQVEDLLPESPGFTGRFYTLKDELLQKDV